MLKLLFDFVHEVDLLGHLSRVLNPFIDLLHRLLPIIGVRNDILKVLRDLVEELLGLLTVVLVFVILFF